MRFTKMHGAGNDYIYVDAFQEKVRPTPAFIRKISDRNTGIGSDGLILIAPSKKADFRMVMYNADGSRGAMCGNGVRCIGKYVHDHRLTRRRKITVETDSGVVSLVLHLKGKKVDRVTVDMGAPHGKIKTRTLSVGGVRFPGFDLSMGNPHFVTLVDNVEDWPVERFGPLLENHRVFPDRANIEFVEVISSRRVLQRTWERGSGETHACGSGACAVAAALHRQGITGRKVRIDLIGGRLDLQITPSGGVLMTGPAEEVFEGTWPTTAPRKR